MEGQRYQHIETIAKKTNRQKLQKTNKMDDLKNLTGEMDALDWDEAVGEVDDSKENKSARNLLDR